MTSESYRVTYEEFDRLFEKLKNWGRWGDDDELGTLGWTGSNPPLHLTRATWRTLPHPWGWRCVGVMPCFCAARCADDVQLAREVAISPLKVGGYGPLSAFAGKSP